MLVDTKYKKLGDYTELESVAIDETGSASNTILPAPPAGKQNLIYKIWFVTTVDTTIQFKDGATDLTGAIDLPSGGSVMLDYDIEPWFTTAGAFIISNSASTQISGRVHYLVKTIA